MLFAMFESLFVVWFVLNDPITSYGIIGDTQANWHIARKAYAEMEKEEVESLFHLGDVWGCGSLNRWKQLTSYKFFGTHMCFTHFVIGNHELLRCGTYKYAPGEYRKKWIKHFIWQDREIPKWWWKAHPYKTYAFKRLKHNTVAILLDSATPGVSRHQLKWLREVLKYFGSHSATTFIIFSHRGLPCRSCNGFWYRRLDNMPYKWRNIQLWKLIQQYKHKIVGAFHGHWHGYRHYNADGIPTWCSGGGGGLLAPRQKYHWLRLNMWENTLMNVEFKEIK